MSESVIYSEAGRALGFLVQEPTCWVKDDSSGKNRWVRQRRPLTKAERKWVATFLEGLYERKANLKGARDMSSNAVVNEVKLAGTIKKIKAEAGRFFALVDVSQEKWVPCTAHEKDERGEKDLISNLFRFREGDSIVFKGYVRPWSMKDGDSWKNGMDIRITNLKPGSVPQREPIKVQGQQQQNDSGSW